MSMVGSVTCPDGSVLTFDIAAVAGFYSQLTGVLAGLAFAALIFLISARLDAGRSTSLLATDSDAPDDGDHDPVVVALGSAYRMLIASFLALTVSSLGYAVLGGSAVSSGRAATEEVVLAVSFSLAGAMLFYAIVLTLDATESLAPQRKRRKLPVSSHVRDVLVGIVAPLVVLYSALGLTDYADIRYGIEHGWSPLEAIGVSAIILQLIVSWIAYPIYCRSRSSHAEAVYLDALTRSTTRLGWAFMLIVMASVVTFGVIDASVSEDPCGTLSPAVPISAFLATVVSMFALTTQVARFRTPPAQKKPTKSVIATRSGAEET